jgi:predicted transcriptional regulator
MRYRSRLEIISSILHTTSNGSGATKTRIMYGVYLSYSQSKEYLGFLVERGLIEYQEGTHAYKPTEKGLRFLKAAQQAEALIGVEPEAQVDRAPFSPR